MAWHASILRSYGLHHVHGTLREGLLAPPTVRDSRAETTSQPLQGNRFESAFDRCYCDSTNNATKWHGARVAQGRGTTG
eukprot:4694651-Amphidinium_carterae.1